MCARIDEEPEGASGNSRVSLFLNNCWFFKRSTDDTVLILDRNIRQPSMPLIELRVKETENSRASSGRSDGPPKVNRSLPSVVYRTDWAGRNVWCANNVVDTFLSWRERCFQCVQWETSDDERARRRNGVFKAFKYGRFLPSICTNTHTHSLSYRCYIYTIYVYMRVSASPLKFAEGNFAGPEGTEASPRRFQDDRRGKAPTFAARVQR